MGWKHPEIGLEEMVKLLKGFVDILILSSGCQSSGRLAHWDAPNVKKAFHWALFFERVLSELKDSYYYDESVEELDVALSELKSHAAFPQGLAHISSDTLMHARGLIAEHMIQILPLRDMRLKAVMTASTEMDLESLTETAPDGLSRYLNKLSLQIDSIVSFRDPGASGMKSSTAVVDSDTCDWTSASIRELSRRQSAVSIVSSSQKGLNVVSNSNRKDDPFQVIGNIDREQLTHGNFSVSEDEMAEFVVWHRWKFRSLSYFLDERTIRLVSGVSMMFSSQKNQWVRVLECLANSENLHARVELLLLGCITDRCSSIIKHLQSSSFDCLATSDRFAAVHNLLLGRYQRPFLKEESVGSKENSILDHLTEILHDQLQVLWALSPALVAAAIPSGSTMFRLYLGEIENHLKGKSPTPRCCGCTEEMKEHKDCDCELAERIWCLYAFHVSGSLANGQ